MEGWININEQINKYIVFEMEIFICEGKNRREKKEGKGMKAKISSK